MDSQARVSAADQSALRLASRNTDSYLRITTHRTWGYERLHSQHVWAKWKHETEEDTQQLQPCISCVAAVTLQRQRWGRNTYVSQKHLARIGFWCTVVGSVLLHSQLASQEVCLHITELSMTLAQYTQEHELCCLSSSMLFGDISLSSSSELNNPLTVLSPCTQEKMNDNVLVNSPSGYFLLPSDWYEHLYHHANVTFNAHKITYS